VDLVSVVRKIINTEDVSMPEALRILEDRVLGGGQLLESEVLKNTLDYLRRFSKIDSQRARELIEELVKRFGIARITAIQLVNLMPTSIEEIRIILGIERREFTDQELQEVLDTLGKYR
jgi:DNA-directed RNA polymerase subunit F